MGRRRRGVAGKVSITQPLASESHSRLAAFGVWGREGQRGEMIYLYLYGLRIRRLEIGIGNEMRNEWDGALSLLS